MGLEDSGTQLKIVSSNEGGYYDLATNTVYINKDWVGENLGAISGNGDKSEIFGGIAAELSHASQWIDILRNGGLDDNSALLKKLLIQIMANTYYTMLKKLVVVNIKIINNSQL